MPATTPIRDSFNRANENPATGWTRITHFSSVNHQVVSNAVKAAAGSSVFDSYFTGLTAGPDCESYVQWTAKGSHQWVTLRVANPGASTDGYYIELIDNGGGGNDDIVIQRFDNSANTPLASGKLTIGSSGELRATIIGTVITAYVDNVQLLQTTDSTYTAAGFIGCGGISNSGNTGPVYDWFGGGTLPTIVEATSAIVAGAAGLAPYTGLVATRGMMARDINATNRQSMSRTGHFATCPIASLRIQVPNWYISAHPTLAETGTGSAMSVTASIEYPASTFTQVLFGGSASGSASNGATLTSDAVSVTIPEGAKFWVRIYRTSTTGILTNAQDVSGGATIGDGFEMGVSGITDKTMSGTVTAADNSMGPLAIIGTTTKPSVVVIGDSIGWGTGDDTGDATGTLGIVTRSLGTRVAFSNLSMYADNCIKFLASNALRAAVFPYASHMICQYGFNDIYDQAQSSANTLSRLASIWALFTALSPYKKVYQTTLTPNTSSTDSWATTGNQTAVSGNTNRVAVNTSIRTVPAGLTGYFETANVLESSQDSGIWKAPGKTADGIHPTTTGYTDVRNAAVVSVPIQDDGNVTGAAATVKATTGSSAGQGASAGTSGKIAGVTGSSTGQGTASATSGKTAGTTGSSTGQGSSAGASGKTAGTPGTSTGQASASGAPGATVGTTGTSAGQGSADGQSGKTAGSTGSSAGQSAVSGISGKTAGTTGSSDGTSQATGDGLDVGGTGVTGSAAGQATVAGVSSKIEGRTGSSAGVGQSPAAPSSIQAQAGSSVGQGQALGQAGRIVGVSGSSSGSSAATGATDSDEAEVLVPMVSRQARARKLWANASRRQFSVMASARR